MAFDFPLIPAVLLTTAGVFARKYDRHFGSYYLNNINYNYNLISFFSFVKTIFPFVFDSI